MALATAWGASAQDNSQDSLPAPAPGFVDPPVEQIYPCNPGNFVPSPELGLPDVPPAVDCGEVIVPPTGLDPGITEPLPEQGAGKLRVIPPSAIEPQQ
jgi:hypothetical protein